MADVLGVDTLEYMNYENGSKMINYNQMKTIASLYHIDLVEVFKNSDDVTLYEINKANTDEINIEYFTSEKSFTEKIKDFYQQNKIASIIIGFLLLTIIVMFIVLQNTTRPYTLEKENINRLSVSETTVVYIDNYSRVIGSGSNTNGELSNLTSSGAIKVCEGEGFTIILNDDGSVSHAGLISKYANSVDDWKNIVDIAAGSAHVIGVDSNGRVSCVGDDSFGACDINGTRNISKVYATKNGSILVDRDGALTFSGSFIGSGSIRNYYGVKDIASSNNILALLCSDNTIDVYTKNSLNYLQAESWNEIVDVACGDSFVAGLDRYGKVHIEIDNDEIKGQVEVWSNIIAIDGASDYLIAYDGTKIYGVGNNSYGQFVKEEIIKQRLEMVSNVEYNIDEKFISVQFDGVSNASGYIVGIDVGIGMSRRLEDVEVVKFDTVNMTEGKNYTITITSIGEGDYTDSDPYKLSFTYNKPEEKYYFKENRNQTVDEFKQYLISLGVKEEDIRGLEAEETCTGEEVTLLSDSLSGKSFTRSELLSMIIEYTYCKIEDVDEEE